MPVTLTTGPVQRIANKAQAAEFFGVSPQAIDGWIRRGCPAEQRAAPGRPWKFDLLRLAEWRFSSSPDSGPNADPDTMTPKERLDHFRAESEKLKLSAALGQVIPVDQFERELARAFKSVASTLESLPDVLERDAGLSGAAVERCQALVDRLREEMHGRINADLR